MGLSHYKKPIPSPEVFRNVLLPGDAFGMHKLIMEKEFGIEATAFDCSEYSVRNAVSKIDLHNAIDPFPYKYKSFDIVMALDVCEHIPEEFLPSVVENCAKVSKKWFFLRVPMWGYVKERFDSDLTHVTIKSDKWWMDLFSTHFRWKAGWGGDEIMELLFEAK